MASEDRTVKLKDGSTEFEPLVEITMKTLNSLLSGGLPSVIALYDLVMLCRDSSYVITPPAEDILSGLLTRGEVHEAIRHIILSAVEGESFEDMKLVSPLA